MPPNKLKIGLIVIIAFFYFIALIIRLIWYGFYCRITKGDPGWEPAFEAVSHKLDLEETRFELWMEDKLL